MGHIKMGSKRKMGGHGLGYSSSGYGQVAGTCKHGNKTFDAIKYRGIS
jgi:hypothetical protein